MRAPCQVFEQLPQQMVYRERGDGIWQALKCYHSPWLALNGCCYILVGLGWSPLFPDGPSIVAVISWWVLDGYCYFLLCPGWSVFSLWAMDGYRYFSTAQILAPCAHRARYSLQELTFLQTPIRGRRAKR